MGLRRQETRRKTKRGPDLRGPTRSDHHTSPNNTQNKVQAEGHKGRDRKNTQQRKRAQQEGLREAPTLGQLGSRNAQTQRCNPDKQHQPTPNKRPTNHRAGT